MTDNVRKMWSDSELDAALADLRRDAGSADRLAAARAALLQAAGDTSVTTPEERVPGKKHTGSWRWIAVAAAVAVLTGGLVIGRAVLTPGPEKGTHEVASPLGLTWTDPPVRPGQYRYARKSVWALQATVTGDGMAYVEQVVETWIPADPKGEWHRRWTQTDNVRWQRGGPDTTKIVMPHPLSFDETGPAGLFPGVKAEKASIAITPQQWGTPDLELVNSLLPLDVPALADRLLNAPPSLVGGGDGHRQRSPAETMGRVLGVLELGVAKGELRSALCQALATVDGISVTKEGTTTVFWVDNTKQMMVVDTATSQLISSTTAVGPASAVPTPMSTGRPPAPQSGTIGLPFPVTTPGAPASTNSTPSSIPQATTTKPSTPAATDPPLRTADSASTYTFSVVDHVG